MIELAPCMTPAEIQMLTAFLRCSDDYVEFGSGGSTLLAASLVARSVTSIETSEVWAERVRAACASCRVKPTVVHVDIGSTEAWGAPADPADRRRGIDYHERIWTVFPAIRSADLYLLDGPYRIASFLQCLLHAEADAVLLIHDFEAQPRYHVLRALAREIACEDDLSAFSGFRRPDIARIKACLSDSAYDPY